MARDTSGGGNDMSLGDGSCSPGVGLCPSWVNGKVGSALDFDGNDDRIQSNTINWAFTNQITMEAWFKNEGIGGANPRIVEISRAENSVAVLPGKIATITHTCLNINCNYRLVFGGMSRVAYVSC
jgi:hypothetical protein